jgi:Domain of unknown function (DUF4129)
MSGEGAHRRAVVAVVVAVTAVALVTVVAAGARVPLATEGSRGLHLTTRDAPDRVERPAPRLPPDRQEPSELPSSAGPISVLFDALLIAGALALLFAGGQALRRNWPRSRPSAAPSPPEDPTMPPAPAIVDALDEGLGTLDAGPVDDVVIACWVHLEDAAATAGVARLTSETPSELASRVLTDLHAPPLAVDRLLTRYRTARYSRHPLGEDDRVVAIRSLEDIRAAIVGAAQ